MNPAASSKVTSKEDKEKSSLGIRGEDHGRCIELGTALKNLSGYGERHVKKEGTIRNPVTVLEELIAIHTNEGKSVLDCFMGSGSTRQAALNLNRKFIGLTSGI